MMLVRIAVLSAIAAVAAADYGDPRKGACATGDSAFLKLALAAAPTSTRPVNHDQQPVRSIRSPFDRSFPRSPSPRSRKTSLWRTRCGCPYSR